MHLEIKDLQVYYGKIEAIKGISFHVNQGEIVTLIGANGAGKTTTLKTISGLRPVSGGQIIFEGQDISKVQAHLRTAMGISMAPEGRGIFPGMTVLENLEIGKYFRKDRKNEMAEDLAEVYELFPRLKERASQAGGTLSGGEQQMLAIGRALMTNPTLLLMDEPSEGLAPAIVQHLEESLQGLVAQGQQILLIEQNLRFATSLCDEVVILSNGEIQATVQSKELVASPELQNKYLGVA